MFKSYLKNNSFMQYSNTVQHNITLKCTLHFQGLEINYFTASVSLLQFNLITPKQLAPRFNLCGDENTHDYNMSIQIVQ